MRESILTTLVEGVGFGDIQWTQLISPKRYPRLLGHDCVFPLLGKGVGPVVHHAGVVVAITQCVRISLLKLVKCRQQLLVEEIVSEDIHILVPVVAGVLVVESNDVSNLVDNGSKEHASRTKGDPLRLEKFVDPSDE